MGRFMTKDLFIIRVKIFSNSNFTTFRWKRILQPWVFDGFSTIASIKNGKITGILHKVGWNHRLSFCLKHLKIMEIFIALRRMPLECRVNLVPSKLFPQVRVIRVGIRIFEMFQIPKHLNLDTKKNIFYNTICWSYIW